MLHHVADNLLLGHDRLGNHLMYFWLVLDLDLWKKIIVSLKYWGNHKGQYLDDVFNIECIWMGRSLQDLVECQVCSWKRELKAGGTDIEANLGILLPSAVPVGTSILGVTDITHVKSLSLGFYRLILVHQWEWLWFQLWSSKTGEMAQSLLLLKRTKVPFPAPTRYLTAIWSSIPRDPTLSSCGNALW